MAAVNCSNAKLATAAMASQLAASTDCWFGAALASRDSMPAASSSEQGGMLIDLLQGMAAGTKFNNGK